MLFFVVFLFFLFYLVTFYARGGGVGVLILGVGGSYCHFSGYDKTASVCVYLVG